MQTTLKIPIVNENDEVIGLIPREDRSPNHTIRITAVWITDYDGNILLQQRSLNKQRSPGLWGPAVSGTLEEGETYESNAYKEMFEEIGVKDAVLMSTKKVYGTSMAGGKRFCQIYTAVIDKKTNLAVEEDEVGQVKWFGKDELRQMINHSPESFVGLMSDLESIFLN